MFSRAVWVLLNGKPEFSDPRLNLPFGQQRLCQAAMTAFPTGVHAVELTELGDSRVIVSLIAICIAEIVAHGGFTRREPLSLAVGGNRIVKLPQIM